MLNYMCGTHSLGRSYCSVIENKEIEKDIYQMVVQNPRIATEAKPGQFVNLYCQSDARLLPRPISICEVDAKEGWVKLIYASIGTGTKSFVSIREGEEIELLGPLGNGYSLIDSADFILVGGGVGTPPLLELAKKLPGRKTIYLGFRNSPYLIEELEKYGAVYIATDDGSVGYHGNIVELMKTHDIQAKVLYACGPKPMLNAIQKYAAKREIQAQLSLEERMGCGFGACVGCVCKIKVQNETGYTYKKVCKDGPVFDAREVIFE